jgi:hypothetical protein
MLFFTHNLSLDFLPFQKTKAMVLSFLTNPYNNYYAANLKEFISLDKAAKQDFHPEICYDLLPSNVNSCAANLKKFSKQFGYRFLLNIATTCQTDASNSNTFVYSNQIHMLKTWNRVTENTSQSMQARFGEHTIGFKDQIPTIKLQN